MLNFKSTTQCDPCKVHELLVYTDQRWYNLLRLYLVKVVMSLKITVVTTPLHLRYYTPFVFLTDLFLLTKQDLI